MSAERPQYPYGYRQIQQPRVVAQSIPDRERQRASTRRQNLKNMKSYKVLLIGESGVGKSTLVARLCEDRFMAESRQYTLGECVVLWMRIFTIRVTHMQGLTCLRKRSTLMERLLKFSCGESHS